MNGPDTWDLAEEVEARKAMAEAVAHNDEMLRSIPNPRFTPRGCNDGAHHMRRDPAGLRTWVCTNCALRRPFNIAGDA